MQKLSERLDAYARRMWRWGRVFIPIWIAIVVLLTVASALSEFSWDDALFGLSMIVLGFIFLALWTWLGRIRGLDGRSAVQETSRAHP